MKRILFSVVIVGCALSFSGCKQTDQASKDNGHSLTDQHAHASSGPHKGLLIELGEEEFHAELVHDGVSVTIYVLDSAAKTAVPIAASEVTINLLHDGSPEQFQLLASPQDGDAEGKSSRFTLADAELAYHIDDETAKPKLMLTINDVAYRGEILHEHDHDEHSHAEHADHLH